MPDIHDFLLVLKTPHEIRRFGLRKMKAMAELPPDGQRRQFAQLRALAVGAVS